MNGPSAGGRTTTTTAAPSSSSSSSSPPPQTQETGPAETAATTDSLSQQLNVHEDPTEYSAAQMRDLIQMITNASRGGFTKRVPQAYGLLGFVRFTRGYYLILVTQRRKVGFIGFHNVYEVADITLIPLVADARSGESATRRKAANAPLYPNLHKDVEQKYVNTFMSMELSKDFYFSYTYDLTQTLQFNMTAAAKAQAESMQDGTDADTKFEALYNSHSCDNMFMWNTYLLDPIEGRIKDKRWMLPIIHGYYGQHRFDISGRFVDLIVIGRRSRFFAGTRYLKRGVTDSGHVANHVETEQIVCDESSFVNDSCNVSSMVQLRGSIPLFWSQDVNTKIKPPIYLGRFDPSYEASQRHFKQLEKRHGHPIIVLDLIKQVEKSPRESKLGTAYKEAIDHINQGRPPNEQICFVAWDFKRNSKKQPEKVLNDLAAISEQAIDAQGFFCTNHHHPCSQSGILRHNCIDCLDRTNISQFFFGKHCLSRMFHAMGIIEAPNFLKHSSILEVLVGLFQAMGDRISIQYGGSNMVSAGINHRGFSWDIVTNIRRFYSNNFTDVNKQDAMNLFLGTFITPAPIDSIISLPPPPPPPPAKGESSQRRSSVSSGPVVDEKHLIAIQQQQYPHLWDLETDNYLHSNESQFALVVPQSQIRIHGRSDNVFSSSSLSSNFSSSREHKRKAKVTSFNELYEPFKLTSFAVILETDGQPPALTHSTTSQQQHQQKTSNLKENLSQNSIQWSPSTVWQMDPISIATRKREHFLERILGKMSRYPSILESIVHSPDSPNRQNTSIESLPPLYTKLVREIGVNLVEKNLGIDISVELQVPGMNRLSEHPRRHRNGPTSLDMSLYENYLTQWSSHNFERHIVHAHTWRRHRRGKQKSDEFRAEMDRLDAYSQYVNSFSNEVFSSRSLHEKDRVLYEKYSNAFREANAPPPPDDVLDTAKHCQTDYQIAREYQNYYDRYLDKLDRMVVSVKSEEALQNRQYTTCEALQKMRFKYFPHHDSPEVLSFIERVRALMKFNIRIWDRVRHTRPTARLFTKTGLTDLMKGHLYRRCFIGSEAVEFILELFGSVPATAWATKGQESFKFRHLKYPTNDPEQFAIPPLATPICTRAAATDFLQVLVDGKLFHHVLGGHPFIDGYFLYTFEEDQDIHVLNMYYPYNCESSREAVSVSIDLMMRMIQLLTLFGPDGSSNSSSLSSPRASSSSPLPASASSANLSNGSGAKADEFGPHSRSSSAMIYDMLLRSHTVSMPDSQSTTPTSPHEMKYPSGNAKTASVQTSHGSGNWGGGPSLNSPKDEFPAINIEALMSSEGLAQFLEMTSELQRVDINSLTSEQRTCFFLNIHNVLFVHAMLCMFWAYGTTVSNPAQLDIFTKTMCYQIAGHMFSLHDIKYGILCGNRRGDGAFFPPFYEPQDLRRKFSAASVDCRIHFALASNFRQKPRLIPFTERNLDQLLQVTAEFWASHNVKINPQTKEIAMSKLACQEDFGASECEILYTISRFLPSAQQQKLQVYIDEMQRADPGTTPIKLIFS